MSRERVLRPWRMSEPKNETKCEECKKVRQCAFIVDPYNEEVYNEAIEKWLRDDCYYNLFMDT